LDYYGKLFGLDASTRSKRIDELLEMVGLDAAQHRPVREYSKGMQRRIGLAQALINDPDLLILDEPTTGLDPIGTRQVKDLIIELGRRGKTIILSSHLLADVEDVVSRMVILYGGKIRDEGTCDELLTKGGTTTIEADELDDATLAEIDRVIRERSGGHQSIQRVTKPRQKLEELFVGIVERARTEQLSTSGASAGGATAAFLQSDAASTDASDGPSGDDLISSLVSTTPRTEADEHVAPVQDAAAATNANPPEPEAPGIDRAALEALSNASSMDDSSMDDSSTGIGAERPGTHASDASSDKTRRGDQQRDTNTPVTERSKSDGPKVDLDVIGSLLDASPSDADDDSKPMTDASASADDDTPETTR
jgi:energy-coupling factor transporter ATP-binding protein EcfA2